MNSSFASRRKARRIGADDEEPDATVEQEPVVRKPTSKPKKKSKLHLSFGAGGTSMTDDVSDGEAVVIPKKTGIRRKVLERASIQKSSISSEALPVRAGRDDDRPSYSKDYLQELRDSTPSTPKNVSLPDTEDEKEKALDIAGKFGEVVQFSGQSAIPSEAEIREKKERRSRLAKEQEYISLNDTGLEDDEDEWSLSKKPAEAETRLVRDDEDFAEGFDDFVEDGRIAMGKRAEIEQKRRQRADMKELINDAEDLSDDDDSETERRAAYETAQTRAGMDGLKRDDREAVARPKTPPKITSLPTLASKLAGLRMSVTAMENSKMQFVNRLEELRKEKVEISEREIEIQNLLKEAGDKYEKLRAEAGLTATTEKLITGADVGADHGLDNLGAVFLPAPDAEIEED
ncbi:hypothetical protein FQN49_001844 [Arthroderma sp. PD_2]|nr:hypothetical protein FQN49_001844 [Arthroderma sp. PD_2]